MAARYVKARSNPADASRAAAEKKFDFPLVFLLE
jgi:hypothetical protein